MASAIKRILDKEQLKFAFLLLIFYCLIFFSGALWRIDNVVYDAHMKYWSQPAPSDVVIVEIDEQSLRTYGRWPWPRSVHAELVEKLSAINTKGIVLDLIFSEHNSHDTQSDAKLIEAIKNNGKVILPVIVEHNRLNGQLIETLPFPELLNSAYSIGHVHVELDQDGIARSTYLQEGLTTPHWDNISLSLYELVYGQNLDFIPGSRNPQPVSDNPNVWVRDYHVHIPFIGAPGHLARVSYADVLSPDFPLSTLDNKIIFIGATATGLGDALPTPVSGERNAMPGVEINATIFHALRTNTLIEKSGAVLTLLVGVIFVLLPVFIFPRVSPLAALLSMLAVVIGLTIVTIILLRMYHLWIPPTASLAVLLGSFPLWSWRRLDLTVKSLNEELELLNSESSALKYRVIHSLNEEFNFLSKVVPVLRINISSRKLNQYFNFGSNEKIADDLPSRTVSINDWLCHVVYEYGVSVNKTQKNYIFNHNH